MTEISRDIEACFRKLKTTGLGVRPMFHWTPGGSCPTSSQPGLFFEAFEQWIAHYKRRLPALALGYRSPETFDAESRRHATLFPAAC